MNIFPVLTPSAVRMFSVVATSKNHIMHAESVGDEERRLAALKLMSDLTCSQANLVKQSGCSPSSCLLSLPWNYPPSTEQSPTLTGTNLYLTNNQNQPTEKKKRALADHQKHRGLKLSSNTCRWDTNTVVTLVICCRLKLPRCACVSFG